MLYQKIAGAWSALTISEQDQEYTSGEVCNLAWKTYCESSWIVYWICDVPFFITPHININVTIHSPTLFVHFVGLSLTKKHGFFPISRIAAYTCNARCNPVIFLSNLRNISDLYIIEWIGKSVWLYLRHAPYYFEQGRCRISVQWPMGTKVCCCYSNRNLEFWFTCILSIILY